MKFRTRIYLIIFASFALGVFFILSMSNSVALTRAFFMHRFSSPLYPMIFIVSLFLTFLMLRTTEKELDLWQDFAQSISTGNLGGYFDNFGNNELGYICKALHTMIDRYNEAMDIFFDREQRSTRSMTARCAEIEETLHRQESELEEAHRHARLLMDLTTEGVIELDNDNKVVYVNETTLEMLNREESELLGQGFFEVFRHGLTEECTCADEACPFRKAIRSENKQKLNLIWIKDGADNSVPVTVSVSPIYRSGSRAGSMIAFIDLTEVISSSKMTQALYENTAEGYIIFSEHLEPIDCNPFLIEMFGASGKEEILQNFLAFSPQYQMEGAGSSALLQEFLQDSPKSRRRTLEWTHINTVGEEIPCRVIVTSVNVNKKKFFIASIRDLRERKQAERAFREQREQLRRVLDSAPVAMIIIEDMNVKAVNDVCVSMFGLRAGDRLDIKKIYAAPEKREQIVEAIRSGNPVKGWPVQVYGVDGRVLDTLMTVYPFRYEGKNCSLAWVFDVTELMHAKEAAEAASRAKSDFVAIMSHEIKTPLNAILGLCHLCLKTELNNKQSDYLAKITNAGGVLLALMNDILDLSRFEAGNLPLMNAPFSIDAAMENLYDLVASEAADQNIAFDIRIAPDTPHLFLGDASRLNQVLMNLCNNAVKFTDYGHIFVDVSCQDVGKSQEGNRMGELLFKIEDTGVGISEEQRESIFEPFTQGEQYMTRRYGGSGLGLSLAKRLVESMGGRIWVESELGIGSTFSFTVRMTIADEMADAPATASSGDDVFPEQRENGEEADDARINARVLLVEDNEINQEIAMELLDTFGAAVDVAENGSQAIEALEYNDYDVILMDIQMPVMDGLQATRIIREEFGYPPDELPIVAMTAHSQEEDYEKSMQAGMNDHITKPIDPNQLLYVLRRCTQEQEDDSSTTN